MGIAIYMGEGALSFPLEGKRIGPEEIRKENWEKSVSLFLMPGGRDRPYHASLSGEGCRRIRRFVENGGTYLGICAGAYFGARRVEFDRDFPLEVCEERELAFFPGAAIGPAFGKGTFDYASRKGARAALLETDLGRFYAYYHGGCFFEGDFSGCKVLARYADLPGHPSAILECPVGKGKAILSGIHLETASEELDPCDPFLTPLIPLLASTEPVRRRFWERVLGHFA